MKKTQKTKRAITKSSLIHALRTFLQTAIGYLITNVSLYFGGMDLSNGDIVKDALIGIAVSALSAGAAAVMNMEEKYNNG